MAYNTTDDQGTGSAGVVTAFVLVIVGLILGYLVFNYGGFRDDTSSTGSTINIDLPGVSGGGNAQGTQ